MNKLITTLIALIFVLVSNTATSASGDTINDAIKNKVLRVGICLTGPPMGFRDKDNNPAGLDYEITQAIGKALGVKIEYVEMLGNARIPSLLAHKVDIVACSFTATLERAKAITFSIPYVRSGIKIAVQTNSGIKSIEDLAGKKVAVGRGTTNEAIVKKYSPKAELVYYDAFTDAFLALDQGKVDAALEDSTQVDYLASLKPNIMTLDKMYTSDPICLGLRKDDPDFARWIDMFVSQFISSGQVNEIYQRLWGTKLTAKLTTIW